MDIFTQNKLLVRATILLAVMNLLLIGLFLWKDIIHKPHRQDKPTKLRDVSAILKKELNLSQEQFDQIKILRSLYFEKEKVLAEAIRYERDSINSFMFNKITNEELIRSLARKVAENEYRMELLRFEQAKELKAVCTPGQLEKFEELILEIRDFFKQNDRPPRRR